MNEGGTKRGREKPSRAANRAARTKADRPAPPVADPADGEPEVAYVVTPRKRRSPFGRDWLAVHQSALIFLSRTPGLGGEGLKVFCAMAGRLDFENFILVNQAEIARDIGMARSSFSRALAFLETLGVIARGPKSGISPTFMLNPEVAWKGTQNQHFGALRKARAKGWSLIDGGEQLDLPLADPDPAPPEG